MNEEEKTQLTQREEQKDRKERQLLQIRKRNAADRKRIGEELSGSVRKDISFCTRNSGQYQWERLVSQSTKNSDGQNAEPEPGALRRLTDLLTKLAKILDN